MVRKVNGKKVSRLEEIAIKTTEWVGTTQSIIWHTVFFAIVFAAYLIGINFNFILLFLTTIVSLEAIYLALFIQMTVNRTSESLEDVGEDIEEIAEDVEGLEGGFGEIAEDVEGLEGNINKIRKNVMELDDEVEDISDEIDKFHLKGDANKSQKDAEHIESAKSLQNIQKELITLSSGIIALRDDLEVLKKNLP